MFIRGCYEDLLDQVRSGKFQTYEEAIEFELKQIENALSQLHIDDDGRLVEKPLVPGESVSEPVQSLK